MPTSLAIAALLILIVCMMVFFTWLFYMPRGGECFGIPRVLNIDENAREITFGFHEEVVIFPYEGELPEYVVEGNKVILTFTRDPPKILDIAPEGGKASTAEKAVVLAVTVAIPVAFGVLLFKKGVFK